MATHISWAVLISLMDAATLPISPISEVSSIARPAKWYQEHTSTSLDAPFWVLRQVHIDGYLTLSKVSIDLLRSVFPGAGG